MSTTRRRRRASQDPKRALRAAHEHITGGRLREADALCERILERHPDHAGALHLRGIIAHRSAQSERAARLIAHAIEVDPRPMAPYLDLAGIALARGDPGTAIAALRRALERDPANVAAHCNLGIALRLGGQPAQSAAAFQAAIELAPSNADLYLKLGSVRQESGDLEGALAAYRRAAELAPDVPDIHFNIGTVHGQRGEEEAAIAAYARTIELEPDHARAHRNKGTLHLAMDDPEAALPSSRRAAELMPGDVQAHADCGRALLKLGRAKEAIEAFTRAVRLAPAAPGTHIHLGYAHLFNRDPRAALESIETGLERAPGHTLGLALKSMALVEAGLRERAAPLLDFTRLVRARKFEPPPGFDSLAAFNAALNAHVRAHPTLRYSSTNRSVVAGQGTGELLAEPRGPFAHFEQMIRTAVNEYMAEVCRGTEHPSLSRPPRRWHPTTWATVMDAQGHQLSHFHPPGWLSGVYYSKLPPVVSAGDDAHAGWIEFGPPYSRIPLTATFDVTAVQPEEGLMLLFPSYVCHRTVPFESTEQRISIAFDIVPDP